MGTQSVGRLLWRFSLPGVIAMLVNATYNIADTIFVGGLGPDAIAAVTVAFPIQIILIAIGAGTGVGASSLISRKLGAGQTEEANQAMAQIIVIAVLLGGLMALMGHTVGWNLLKLLGASPQILESSFSYMIIITSGAVIIFINMMGNNLVRAEGNPILPMVAMITGALLNIGLDPLFIYVLDLGVPGAAVATISARAVGAGIIIFYLASHHTEYKIKLSYLIPNFRIWGQIYAVGGPQVLMSLAGTFGMGAAVRIASTFGETTIAVYGIIFRIFMLGFLPCIGISTGALPIIGYNYGANKYARVRSTMLRAVLVSTAITLGVALVAIIFPQTVASVFNRNPQFLSLAKDALPKAFIGFGLVGSMVAFTAFFQGIGRAVPAAIIGVSRRFLLYIPALLLLAHFFGQEGIWYAFPVADLGATVTAVIWTYAMMCKLGIPLWGKCGPSGEHNDIQ